MIPNDQLVTLTGAVTALLRHGETELAGRVNDIVTDAMGQRAAISAGRLKRGVRGAPPRAFAIVAEPGWQAEVHGANAAATVVNKFLTENGGRATVTGNQLQNAISRNGNWLRLVETANGTVALTVARRAGPALSATGANS
jgi:hypothetical protein